MSEATIRVLFVCTGNSPRSEMAEALLSDQARQACPVFPGFHQSLHWGYEDPAEATGTDKERLAVFRRVFIQIGERINQFIPLALRARREATATADA